MHIQLPLRKCFQQSVSARAAARALGLIPRYRNCFRMSVGLDLLQTQALIEGILDFQSSLMSLRAAPEVAAPPGTELPAPHHAVRTRWHCGLRAKSAALPDLWKTLQLRTALI